MKELTRTEMMAIKRVAQAVKGYRKQKAKLEEKINSLNEELQDLEASIMTWEEPVIKITGGFTSEQVLNGEMDAFTNNVEVTPEVPVEEVEETQVEMKESKEDIFGEVTNEIPFN